MSEQRSVSGRDPVSPRERRELATALAHTPAGLWLGIVASLGMIVGGVGPWATAFGYLSLSGTSMQGWREVAAGVVGLAMLGLHTLRGARLPLLFAGVAGLLGAIGAIAMLEKIDSDGAVTVLGRQYRYLDPAWGLYLVLAAAIALVLAAALTWRASRA